jgi:hypothetical protein
MAVPRNYEVQNVEIIKDDHSIVIKLNASTESSNGYVTDEFEGSDSIDERPTLVKFDLEEGTATFGRLIHLRQVGWVDPGNKNGFSKRIPLMDSSQILNSSPCQSTFQELYEQDKAAHEADSSKGRLKAIAERDKRIADLEAKLAALTSVTK